jgi:hypothetical protein
MKMIIFFILLSISNCLLAEVSIRTEPEEISFGKPFRLIIRSNTPTGTAPDLRPLLIQFDIMGTQSSTQYSLVNGKSETVNYWIVLLSAKQEGLLTIPAIKVGSEKTREILINVAKQDATSATSKAPQDIFLITDLSDQKPYVNQQVIYTVKLYNNHHLLDPQYSPPHVDNALFIPLGNPRRYEDSSKGAVYQIQELQYAIFPQKSGELNIVPPSLDAFLYGESPQKISLKAKSSTLKVQPIPPQFTGKDWLPAKQVNLTETYDNSGIDLKQGDTITRSISMEVQGSPAQLLPLLKFNSTKDFNVYPEKPTENNRLAQTDILGKTIVKVTYLFNKSGKITIPKLELPWFNISTGKEEIASLPELSITVLPSAAPEQSSITTPLKKTPVKTIYEFKTLKTFFEITGGFFVGLLMLLFFRKRKDRAQLSESQILQDLKKACLLNEPTLAQAQLLLWAKQKWPNIEIMNLSAICELTQDNNFKEQLALLSKILYGPKNLVWKGAPLWKILKNWKPENKVAKRKNTLLPLNTELL